MMEPIGSQPHAMGHPAMGHPAMGHPAHAGMMPPVTGRGAVYAAPPQHTTVVVQQPSSAHTSNRMQVSYNILKLT